MSALCAAYQEEARSLPQETGLRGGLLLAHRLELHDLRLVKLQEGGDHLEVRRGGPWSIA